MKIVEKQMVEKEVTKGYVCDICNTKFDENKKGLTNTGYRHGAWGNDSYDSWREFDVCSVKCYLEFLKIGLEAIKEYKGQGEKVDDKPFHFVKQLIEFIEGKNERV